MDAEQFERVVERLNTVADNLSALTGDIRVLVERQSHYADRIRSLEDGRSINRDAISKVDQKVDLWVNRVWGAYAALALVCAIAYNLGFIGKSYIPVSAPDAPAKTSPPTTGR